MSPSIVEALIRSACAIATPNLSFQWIGGETMLAGVEFFAAAVALSDRFSHPGANVQHCIQTNGTLINDQWIDFLRCHPTFSLSLSFEILEQLQNSQRPSKNSRQKATFNLVRGGLTSLDRARIPYGVLSVISRQTLRVPAAEWLRSAVACGIRSVGLQMSYDDSYWGDDEVVEGYLGWLAALFEAQADHNETAQDRRACFWIRESYYLYNLIRNIRSGGCSCHHVPSPCPEYLVSVDVDGSVYGYCDAFVGLSGNDVDFLLGNVLDQGLNEIVSSPRMTVLREHFARKRAECCDCRYHELCHGGCPLFKSHRLDGRSLIGINKNNGYCRLQTGLLSYVTDMSKRWTIRRAHMALEDDTSLPISFITNPTR